MSKVRHFLWQNLRQLILDLLCDPCKTSFSKAETLLLNWKTDAKSGGVDGGFVASVAGGGVDVDCCSGGVKDGNDYGMTVECTSEESVITET
ncbi:hypothetical protein Tco_0376186, partial [Tanacetum coccineum]